jgi:hypothetical protein
LTRIVGARYNRGMTTTRPATKGHTMKMNNKMKTFSANEFVTANMKSQGMTEGASYKVIEAQKLDLTSGTYFNYVLEGSDGELLHVRNGHILLNPTTTKGN